MATTIICQQQHGLCLDSQLVEPIATLRLKLSSSIANHFEPSPQKCHFGLNNKDLNTIKINNTTTTPSLNRGGWSFLQSLSTTAASGGGEPTYVHPLARRSSAKILSERSLELCTENLGNETGTTDTVDCGIMSNAWCAVPKPSGDDGARVDGDDGARVDGGEGREKGRRVLSGKRVREGPRSFPPPLTTISGKDSVRVRSHREDGRLVITAVKEQSTAVSCFIADRSEEGRLRLCLSESCRPDFDSREVKGESFENEVNEVEKDEEKEKEKEKEKEEGESEKEVGEMGKIEKFGMGRGGRCKEGGEKQYIVENKSVFWVAT